MPAVITGTPIKFEFADGNSGHVCDFGSAPAVDQWDVLCVNSNTTVSTPAGWDPSEVAVTNQGAYMFTRKAVGGEGSTVTITTSGNHNTSVHWIRLAAAVALDTSTNTEVNSSIGGSTPAHSTGLLAATDETVIAFGALHSIGVADQNAPVWSAGYTAALASIQGSSTTGVIGYTAYKHGAGTAAEAPQVSWSGAGVFNRYMLVLTFTTLAALTATSELDMPVVEFDGEATITEQASAGTGSWEQLKVIADYARQLAAEDAAAPLSACPYCGEPLRTGPGGVLFCIAGDYRSEWR